MEINIYRNCLGSDPHYIRESLFYLCRVFRTLFIPSESYASYSAYSLYASLCTCIDQSLTVSLSTSLHNGSVHRTSVIHFDPLHLTALFWDSSALCSYIWKAFQKISEFALIFDLLFYWWEPICFKLNSTWEFTVPSYRFCLHCVCLFLPSWESTPWCFDHSLHIVYTITVTDSYDLLTSFNDCHLLVLQQQFCPLSNLVLHNRIAKTFSNDFFEVTPDYDFIEETHLSRSSGSPFLSAIS